MTTNTSCSDLAAEYMKAKYAVERVVPTYKMLVTSMPEYEKLQELEHIQRKRMNEIWEQNPLCYPYFLLRGIRPKN